MVKNFILLIMIATCVFSVSFAGEVKNYPVDQKRVQETKQVRQKIEQLKKEGKLLYFNNEHRDGKRYLVNDAGMNSNDTILKARMEFYDTRMKSLMNSGNFEDMEAKLAFVDFYPIIVVLLIAYFLFVKKIRLF